ncbi:MAG: OPT family small oligopeptide transporter [Lasallia pustulata]|uniref:OPT family small oligopeptide transporter n=1 Tax=Lasallia pustulata TaxID=136370 RepID=A0A5M8PTZ7_9LECA|nr:MAG: OPT family small oligopeptide transporter [Lasallia pustulata]
MPQTPLLPGSSQAQETSSYGALPPCGPTGSGNIDKEEEDDDDTGASRIGRRKGKSSGSRRVGTMRPTRSMGTLRSQNGVRGTRSMGTLRSQAGSGSGSRRRTRRSEPAPENIYASGIGLPSGDGAKLFEGLAPTMSTEDLGIGDEEEEEGDGEEDVLVDGEEGGDDDEDPLDNSPYPQVRASVSATDNASLSISTPRMWTLSLLFALLGSGTNLFFSLRYPSVAITPVIALVLVHPLGKAWDKILKRDTDPHESFDNGLLATPPAHINGAFDSKRRRLRLWLAQGKWNEKEHACVYISSNVSFGFAFATDVIVEQVKFYHQDPGVIYQLLLTISTQILGYAFAGLTRRYLVRPPSMIWPGTLMSTAMFTTMHKSENRTANGWSISRWRFFLYVWSGAVAWYFLPGLLMPALSYFNVLTWFAPENVVVANLFGVTSGLGLFPMTFDWAQIAYIGSPLLTPWWAAANVVGGLILVMWIVAPILYYKNVLYSSFMPILSSAVFDDTGKPYDVSKILTPDFLFDREAYEKYSRVYLPITYVLAYAVQFAGLSALVTHTACWHGKDIWKQSKKSFAEDTKRGKSEYQPVNTSGLFGISEAANAGAPFNKRGMGDDTMGGEDVHCRLMKKYEDVPISWYIWTFVAMLAIGIFVVEYYPVHLPWYGLLLALAITSVMFIPVGIVMAITNQHSSLYLICQLVCGILFPGRPVANMVFVTYCYISSAQGVKFSSDLKLGHYMKIPPKLLFTVQMVATLVSSVTQIGVLNWMFAYIPGLCTPQAINGFNCPIARVHFNGSILWGVVGPQRFFGPGALYRHLVWAFLVGALAPIAIWLVARRHKTGILRKINLPVLFGSLGWIPPATGLNFSVWALVCFLFNCLIRRRAPAWWGKYTMTLSAALDSGLAFALVIVFFGFVYPGWMDGFRWWGTEVYKQGCDWRACSYRNVEPGGHFGPEGM